MGSYQYQINVNERIIIIIIIINNVNNSRRMLRTVKAQEVIVITKHYFTESYPSHHRDTSSVVN